MKKFLGKLLIYAAVVAAITLGVNAIYLQLNDSDQGTGKFRSVPENIQVCNFGSSHGENNYSYKEVTEGIGFNFALSSQSLSYDYRIMQYYQDRLEENCTVFLNVSYFSLFGTPETQGADFNSKNLRYYGFLPPEYIKDYDRDMYFAAFLRKNLPATTAGTGMIKTFVSALLGENAIRVDGVQTADDIDLDEAVRTTVQSHIIDNKYDEKGERIINQEEVDALKGMLELCREKNWRPVIITTPFLAEYNAEVDRVEPGFVEGFHELLDSILAEYDVPYYDYSADERFCNDHSLFRDDDHLNENGAKKFTAILMEEVVAPLGGIQ